MWLLSCFFVNSKDRPLLIIEGEYSEVLAGMLRKIILPITYIEPIVINNGTSENSRTCYMLTSYVTRKMMNDKELLAKAIHIRLEDSEMASGYDVEAILNSFEKELPNLLAQIFLTVKIVYLWCLKRTKLSPKVITS